VELVYTAGSNSVRLCVSRFESERGYQKEIKMGYYTDFSLEMIGSENDIRKVHIGLEMQNCNCPDSHADIFSTIASLESGDAVGWKWYNSKDDMVTFSKHFPNVLFVLEGEGADSEDMWRLYVRGGRFFVVEPEIIWPEFDELDISKHLGE